MKPPRLEVGERYFSFFEVWNSHDIPKFVFTECQGKAHHGFTYKGY